MGILKATTKFSSFRAKKSVSFKFETETQPERKAASEYRKHNFSKKFLARMHKYVINSFSANEHAKLAKTFDNFNDSPLRVKYLQEHGYGLFENTVIYHTNGNNLKFFAKIIDVKTLRNLLVKNNNKMLETFLYLELCREDRKAFDNHARSSRIKKLEILLSIDQQTVTKYIFSDKVFPELSTMLQEDIKIALNNTEHKSILTEDSNNENISPNINSGNKQHSNNKKIIFTSM